MYTHVIVTEHKYQLPHLTHHRSLLFMTYTHSHHVYFIQSSYESFLA